MQVYVSTTDSPYTGLMGSDECVYVRVCACVLMLVRMCVSRHVCDFD